MKIDLEGLVDQVNDYERPAARIFKATLEYEADAALIASKLAEDIQFVCRAEDLHTASQVGEGADPAEKNSGFLHWVWMLVVDIARMAPPDHPLQDALVLALDILRQKEGIAPGAGVLEWSELPGLELVMLDRWDIIQDPEAEGDFTEEEFEGWKNQNSFAARLTTPSFAPWMNLPLDQLREALEEPAIEGKIGETRIWVACEWLLRCSGLIFHFVVRPGPHEESRQTLPTGPLCGSTVPRNGIGRWEFWKHRLHELSTQAAELKYDESLVQRMSAAIRAMNDVPGVGDGPSE